MDHHNRLEWLIFGISAAAVAGIIAFLAWDGLTDPGNPAKPIVQLHRDRSYETPTSWLVPATAVNQGDQSAQAVGLLATATVDGATEDAEVTIDYLPAGSKVEVTFGFSGEPEGDIDVHVSGFVQ